MKKYSLIGLLSIALLFMSALAFFFFSNQTLLYDFNTLSDFQRYTSIHPEILPNTLNNINLETYYQNQQPFTAQLLRLLNINTFIHKNIDHVTSMFNTRKPKNYENKSESLLVKMQHDSTLYIWGNLKGSLSTLVNSLTWLQKQQIISDDLIIIKPDSYFVFYDEVLNDSVYGLETLLLIALLQDRNPNSIFYIKDTFEQKNNWQNHTLQIQLKEIFGGKLYITKDIDLAINNFFDSLPSNVYFMTPDGNSLKITTNSINEQTVGITNDIKNATSRVNITTAEGPVKHTTEPGIYLLEQQLGNPSWLVISTSHTKNSNNGFAQVNLISSITKSTIAFLQKNNQEFDEKQKANLLTGGNPNTIINLDSPIKLGSTMSLILGLPTLGKSVKSGILSYINRINEEGGINSELIKFVLYNDNYTPYLARQNIERLINEKTDIIVLPTGSAPLSSYLDLVEQQKIAVLFPITGSPEFRKPSLVNLIHYRASYGDEIRAVVDYMIKSFGLRKFAFFYQDDSYGKAGLGPAHETLKKHGITEWVDIPYSRNSVQLSEQVEKIKNLQPEALGLLSTAQSTRELIRLIGVHNLTSVKLFGLSGLAEDTFRYFTSSVGLSVTYGSVVPNPYTSTLPIVEEYRKAMDALHNPYNSFSLEAYICGAILSHVLQGMSKPVTKEKVLRALEALDQQNIKGIRFTFNPNTRTLSTNLWIETENSDVWIQKEIVNEDAPTDTNT